MNQQAIVFTTLAGALLLFASGRLRYDMVALLALLVVAVAGIVPGDEVFAGFGHPAVITVAAVLVVSRGLNSSGIVDLLARHMGMLGRHTTAQVAGLGGLVAAASAFMNNVGALALLLPVTVRLARKHGTPPSRLLMPLAFGSLLGGLATLIGTPPNVIIATFRAQNGGEPFRMFDFAPAGGAVAVAGLLFVALIGWRLLPERRAPASREELFEVEDYIAELHVPEKSKAVGKTIHDLEALAENDAAIVALVRGDGRPSAPSSYDIVRAGDVLVVEADPEALQELVGGAELEIAEGKDLGRDVVKSEDVGLVEAIVTAGSTIEGRTATSVRLRRNFGVNLIAISRQGQRLGERVSHTPLQAGDILLLQGEEESLQPALSFLGCLPLAERNLRLGQARRLLVAPGIFLTGLALATTGALPVQVAFTAAAVGMVLAGILTLREAYDGIDWSILVLLGGMIPVGQALERSGGAQLLADGLLRLTHGLPPEVTLAAVLIGTMFLSDLINNAAAAVLMAPISIGVAAALGASADPFLMAVAIGASCAFLTPIGHQSNTLVMGPGGYRFSDYWRMGLPLEIVIAAVAIPTIPYFWPF